LDDEQAPVRARSAASSLLLRQHGNSATVAIELVSEKCRSRPMVGSETLTIVRSTTAMKNATASSANARQRLIWGDRDVIRPPVVWVSRHCFETGAGKRLGREPACG
jgi:hypothetical protein